MPSRFDRVFSVVTVFLVRYISQLSVAEADISLKFSFLDTSLMFGGMVEIISKRAFTGVQTLLPI